MSTNVLRPLSIGNRDKSLNLPTNSSISVTLSQDDLRTLTTASASESFEKDQLWLNGKLESLDTPRTQACLADLRKLRASIEQSPTPQVITNEIAHRLGKQFPYCRWFGIVRCWLCSIGFSNRKVIRVTQDMSELSKIARKGSGSACRSLFGGFVAWEMGTLPDGQDSKAVEIAPLEHWPSPERSFWWSATTRKIHQHHRNAVDCRNLRLVCPPYC